MVIQLRILFQVLMIFLEIPCYIKVILQKHFLYATLSFCLMIFISFLNKDFLNKTFVPCFLIFFIMLSVVPFIGIEVKGAKRWLNLYFFNFQPVEFIKPFFVSEAWSQRIL